MKEVIKPIDGCPGYYVSDQGNVYSAWSRTASLSGKPGRGAVITGQMKRLKPSFGSGRWVVGISVNGKRKVYRVHVLVLTAFVGPRPAGMQGCHFPDRDTSNNRLSNLRWDTAKANSGDKVIHETDNSGIRNGSAKLTEDDVRSIRCEKQSGKSAINIAKDRGLCVATVSNICARRSWKHIA